MIAKGIAAAIVTAIVTASAHEHPSARATLAGPPVGW